MTAPTPAEVTAALWDAVYARDWDRVASHLTDDSIYFDVPTGPSTAAKGPAAIVGRLRLGLDPLVRYEHVAGRVVADGDIMMIEHAERWGWVSGEEVTLPFSTVHRVQGDRVVLWKDYWNYSTLLDAAPAEWVERLFSADLWWLYDATDHPGL